MGNMNELTKPLKGPFWVINEEACSLIAYPVDITVNPVSSHKDVWERAAGINLKNKPWNYYPRGRVAYRKTDNKYIIFHDKCIIKEVRFRADVDDFSIRHALGDDKDVIYETDEHYQCHRCNKAYII